MPPMVICRWGLQIASLPAGPEPGRCCPVCIGVGSVRRGADSRVARGASPAGPAAWAVARFECLRASAIGPIQQPQHGQCSSVAFRRGGTAERSPFLDVAKLYLGPGCSAAGDCDGPAPSGCSWRQSSPNRAELLFQSTGGVLSQTGALHGPCCAQSLCNCSPPC